MILFLQLPSISKSELILLKEDKPLTILLTDSRKAIGSEGAVFFAIKGEHHDGHQYLSNLYDQGVRQFIIENDAENFPYTNSCNILKVTSALEALQLIAAHHRAAFHIPVVGITGSNGKTIIKEWLYQLLSDDFKIAKNPGSYNSQLGVPLSVWQLQPHHQLGIFEAGISKPGEMEKLANIINPSIGIFSNIGSAHDEGFKNREEKTLEKLKLFKNSQVI